MEVVHVGSAVFPFSRVAAGRASTGGGGRDGGGEW